MRIRKISVPAMVLGATAMVLTGCGISGSGDSDTPNGGVAVDKDLATQIEEVSDEDLQGATITMARFFGDCNDTTNGVTDIDQATTECEAIQILTNKFEAENAWGIKVERLGGAAWHSYYDGLNTALASSEKPDIAVMHGSNLPEYAARGLLQPVPGSFTENTDDYTAPAVAAVEFEGQQYALPFDSHAIISHLNMDILREAGLVSEGESYSVPSDPEEFMKDAATVKEKTGKTFLDVAMTNDPMAARFWQALIYQQGEDLLNPETGEVNMNSAAAVTSLEYINTLVDNDYIAKTHDYDASVQAFLRGESAIMYNGSWAVNQFAAEAPFEYQVTDAPMLFDTPATWANSHVWAVPTQDVADPVKYRAAFELAKYLHDNTGIWGIKTGHMPASKTALDSAEYLAAPHRDQYLETAKEYGKLPPRVLEWPAIDAAIVETIEATWLNDADVQSTLDTLQATVEGILNK
ncbi:MAG: extracellular solute-binding protein [Actinomycetaceae bacterium]|nr:extracellular solute-binding protein [Actinomycetaceae bacterium]